LQHSKVINHIGNNRFRTLFTTNPKQHTFHDERARPQLWHTHTDEQLCRIHNRLPKIQREMRHHRHIVPRTEITATNMLKIRQTSRFHVPEIHAVVVFIGIHFTILSHISKLSSNRIQPTNTSFFLVCTMTHSILSLETVASVLLLSTIIVGLAPDRTAAHPAPSEIRPFNVQTAIITITEVKTPWYALRFLLKGGFEKSLPEYTAIPGLLQKNYAIHDGGKTFGGFYLWETKAQAEAWFTPKWFERVEKTYGAAGKVTYFTVKDYQAFAKESDAKGDYWTVIHRASAQSAQHTFFKAQGLLRVYMVNDVQAGNPGSISLWNSKEEAERYFASAKISQNELTYTDTPLLLNKLAQ
jgi:hypothetical protein